MEGDNDNIDDVCRSEMRVSFAKTIKEFLYRFEKLDVEKWLSTIFLSVLQTPLPGFINFNSHGFQRKILKYVTDYSVKKIYIMGATQGGKTFIIKMILLICIKMGWHTLFATVNLLMAQSFVKKHWSPIFDDNPKLKSTLDRKRSTMYETFTKTASVIFRGTGTAQQLAGVSCNVVVADEVGKWRDESFANGEASPIDLLDDRVKSMSRKLIVLVSSPNVFNKNIHRKYLEGSQSKYHVPCPHCESFIFLDGSCIVVPPECVLDDGTYNFDLVSKKSYGKCPKCGEMITNRQKNVIMQKGDFFDDNDKAPSFIKSFHYNSLVSPKVTFGDYAIYRIKAESGGVVDKKVYANSWEGFPYEYEREEVDERAVYRRQGGYARYDKTKGKIKILIVDVQLKYMPYVLRSLDENGSYLLDHGSVVTENQLQDLFDEYDCRFLVIDCQYAKRKQEVYNMVKKRERWYMIEGRHLMHKKNEFVTFKRIHPVVGFRGKENFISGIPFIEFRSDIFKMELSKARADRPEFHDWYVYEDLAADYVYELFGEQEVKKYNADGDEIVEFTKIHRNDYFDCETYFLVFVYWYGKEQMLREYNEGFKEFDFSPGDDDGDGDNGDNDSEG